MENKFIAVLGTVHCLQGAKFPGYVHDANYPSLLKYLFKVQRIDAVFEESSGYGPSFAEEITALNAPEIHYADVDPTTEERADYGINAETTTQCPIGGFPSRSCGWFSFEATDLHEKREKIWLQRINQQTIFQRGLVICGIAHVLSLAFRLKQESYSVEAFTYMPYERLCRHNQAQDLSI